MRLYVGCAMWAHKAWPGRFVPSPLPAQDRLRAYAAWCNAVEGNTTFYATPARATVASWAEQTGPDFRFVLKLPKAVTHEYRLADTPDADRELHTFLDAIEPLGPRAHALWVQLPAAFAPADVPVLARFLRRLPGTHRVAVEVRHREFFDGGQATRTLEEMLTRAGAEWLPFDTTVFFGAPPTSDVERETWTMKPRVAARTTALTDRPIVRYLGRDDTERTVEGWRRWVGITAGWLREGRSPTVFIHTPDNVDAPALARRFHEAVRAVVPQLEPLPPTAPVEPLTLF